MSEFRAPLLRAVFASARSPTGMNWFPTVLRMFGRRPRIGLVQQLTMQDCGAACLTMVLRSFRDFTPLEEVRALCSSDGGLASARSLLEAGEAMGLTGHGVALDADDVDELPAGAILHWQGNHFVVLDRVTRRTVTIVDPGLGRRTEARSQFRSSFSGIALIFEPSDHFVPRAPLDRPARRYFQYLAESKGVIGSLVLFSGMTQLAAMATPAISGAVVDRIALNTDAEVVNSIALVSAALLLAYFLVQLARSHLTLSLRCKLEAQMTREFFAHLTSLPFSFFKTRPTGDLLARLSSNSSVREILTGGLITASVDGMMLVTYVAVTAMLSPAFAATVVVLGIIQALIFVGGFEGTRVLMNQELRAAADVRSAEVEIVQGIETLKAMGRVSSALERWSRLYDDGLRLSKARGRRIAWSESALAALRIGSPLFILWMCARSVAAGQMTLGQLVTLVTLASGFFGSLGALLVTAVQAQVLGGYIERLSDVFVQGPALIGSARHRVRGAIRLENISFSHYPGGRPVLKDVTLEIEPGQFVAIVGRSGAGKSSLISVLLGLCDRTVGQILYDGVDLSQLDAHDLRKQIGVVLQDSFLFGGTIRLNIAFWNPALSIEEVEAAARLAHVHDDIVRLPLGYESTIIDSSGALSGGQRQRLALARAIAMKPRLLVLDEATSALDAATERAVYANLARLDCTKIVVAHRLSTVARADQIVVFQDGMVFEKGTHTELLNRGGVYAELVEEQLRPEQPAHSFGLLV